MIIILSILIIILYCWVFSIQVENSLHSELVDSFIEYTEKSTDLIRDMYIKLNELDKTIDKMIKELAE